MAKTIFLCQKLSQKSPIFHLIFTDDTGCDIPFVYFKQIESPVIVITQLRLSLS